MNWSPFNDFKLINWKENFLIDEIESYFGIKLKWVRLLKGKVFLFFGSPFWWQWVTLLNIWFLNLCAKYRNLDSNYKHIERKALWPKYIKFVFKFRNIGMDFALKIMRENTFLSIIRLNFVNFLYYWLFRINGN